MKLYGVHEWVSANVEKLCDHVVLANVIRENVITELRTLAHIQLTTSRQRLMPMTVRLAQM